MKGFQENIPSGAESEKKKNKSSGDLEDLEEEKKKKMKTSLEKSSDGKEDVQEDVKMEKCCDDEEELLPLPLCDSSDEELTESEVAEYKNYVNQMVSSGGFDVDRCHLYSPCTLFPVGNLKEGDEKYLKLCRFSKLAMDRFNLHNGTSYKSVKFVKAVFGICAGGKYYITYEAKEDSDDAPIIFQALVYDGIPIRDGAEVRENVIVILVRRKSDSTEKDNEILLF